MTHVVAHPATRDSWQAHHADALPVEGPLLPPRTVQDDDELAVQALTHAVHYDFTARSALAPSPNWNALVGGQPLAVPLQRDVHARMFLGDRADRVEAASRSIYQQYPRILEQLRGGVARAVAEGYAPPVVAQRLEDAFRLTSVQLADQAALGGALGAYYAHNDSVVLSAELEPLEVATTIAHELLGHKASGGTFRRPKADHEKGPVRTRVGFDENGKHEALDEAVQQHMILGYLTGDFATIDPDNSADQDRHYYNYRKLLAAFVGRSNGDIDLRNITQASYEDTDEMHADIGYRREMVEDSIDAYGLGAYRKFAQLCKAADAVGTGPNSTQELQALIDRIHGPVVSERGVAAPGFIDTEGLPALAAPGL